MITNRCAAAVLVATLALIPCASADETTLCNAYITALPYTISTQGHYCFDRNLATGITSGAAITINTDFVVLDLNNFKLGGGSAGPATTTAAIYAANRSNITVRNGNIRGFAYGILIEGTNNLSAKNITVENNVLDGNLVSGITVFGTTYSIRNNQVNNTGGSTSTTAFNCIVNGPITTGISDLGPIFAGTPSCNSGDSSGEIVGNTVMNAFPAVVVTGSPQVFSIIGSVVAMNRVINQTGTLAAIWGTVCRDNTALNISHATAYSCNQLVGTNSDF